MIATERRMVVVAVLVCGFAIGMACLLNHFKYRSTEVRLVHERLLVTGRAIEMGIQSALALGLNFTDIGTLPATLERERATDRTILSIDIFDVDGRLVLSTDRLRSTRPVPKSWLAAAAKADTDDWAVESGEESAAGMAIQNHIGLKIGYVALRYSHDKVDQSVAAVGRQLAMWGMVVFAVAAPVASLLMLRVMRRLARDVQRAEAMLNPLAGDGAAPAAKRGTFDSMLRRFARTANLAEQEIAVVNAALEREARR